MPTVTCPNMSYNLTMLMEKKIQSFRYAITGIGIAWREEFNFRFDVVLGICALLLAWVLKLSREEFLIIIFMIGFVLTAEALNTALEELCDKFQPTHDPHIAKIKDLAAGAVLVAALTVFVVGCVLFIPHIISLL